MLTYANRKQIALANQVARERGLTINKLPETSAGLARLIQGMIAKYPALPVTEAQTETYQTLVGECVAKVENFNVERFATLPEDQASANKAIWAMRGLLRGADARHTGDNLDSFVSLLGDEASPGAESDNPSETSVEEDIDF